MWTYPNQRWSRIYNRTRCPADTRACAEGTRPPWASTWPRTPRSTCSVPTIHCKLPMERRGRLMHDVMLLGPNGSCTKKLRIRGFFCARKNSCRRCLYEVKCRKALWLRAREALWSNCKRTQRFFLCKKFKLLVRSRRSKYQVPVPRLSGQRQMTWKLRTLVRNCRFNSRGLYFTLARV